MGCNVFHLFSKSDKVISISLLESAYNRLSSLQVSHFIQFWISCTRKNTHAAAINSRAVRAWVGRKIGRRSSAWLPDVFKHKIEPFRKRDSGILDVARWGGWFGWGPL